MKIAMYAVYYTVSDGCTYTSDNVLFVTESEQTAKDAVALAELEYEEALKIPIPESMLNRESFAIWNNYFNALVDERLVYNQKIKSILTVHQDRADNFYREDNNSYYYEEVEVR